MTELTTRTHLPASRPPAASDERICLRADDGQPVLFAVLAKLGHHSNPSVAAVLDVNERTVRRWRQGGATSDREMSKVVGVMGGRFGQQLAEMGLDGASIDTFFERRQGQPLHGAAARTTDPFALLGRDAINDDLDAAFGPE